MRQRRCDAIHALVNSSAGDLKIADAKSSIINETRAARRESASCQSLGSPFARRHAQSPPTGPVQHLTMSAVRKQEAAAAAAAAKEQSAAAAARRPPENGSGDACNGGGVDRTNLIVNYLPQSTSNYDLIMLFKFAGELESVKIIRHPRTGYSYGYGFVKYTSPESAANAIDLFDRLPYRNKILKVSYSRPSSQVSKNSNLYISNLPKVYNEQHLLNLFGQYGEIIQHRLLRDRTTSMPRGVAFVRFASSEHAQDAIRQLNGVKLAQSPLQVRIADDFSHQRATSAGYDLLHASQHFDLRGLSPVNFVPRSFALPPPAMLRAAGQAPARFVGGGGGGDFNAPFPMSW